MTNGINFTIQGQSFRVLAFKLLKANWKRLDAQDSSASIICIIPFQSIFIYRITTGNHLWLMNLHSFYSTVEKKNILRIRHQGKTRLLARIWIQDIYTWPQRLCPIASTTSTTNCAVFIEIHIHLQFFV